MAEDLELGALGGFTGTMAYHSLKPLFNTVATDGVAYIMENGYSWFVTDAIAVIEQTKNQKIKHEPFLVISLHLEDGGARMTIDDGNGNILYEQEYEYTDAKRELKLYWQDGVVLLAGEY